MTQPEAVPDASKVAADVIVKLIESSISAVVGPTQTAARRALQAISDAYRPYLESTYHKVRTIRTFLKPNESVDLLSHYVPASLKLTDNLEITADDLIEDLLKGERIVVSGIAGRGKSVLLRYIALSLYHAPRGKMPLFLELRALNQTGSKDILQLLHSQYRGKSSIRFDDFVAALHKGYFLLVLDGFDEVEPQSRGLVEAQITDIAHRFQDCPVLLSGRPDERFQSWEHFDVYNVAPMSFYKTRRIIERATYDVDVKRAFLDRLTLAFFNQHQSFLSTPLLAIMLMLTFEDYAEIPTTLNVFYRNAFDTLVRRHDAMKAQFLRTMHSGCSAEQFRRLFASFCLLTYSKSQYQFHEGDILRYIKAALSQQAIPANEGHVLADLVESICLLQREGFEVSFVHRSFQEYFCALFISHAPAGMVAKYLESGKFRISDNVLPMLYEMVPERVESEWVINTIDELLAAASGADPVMSFLLAVSPKMQFLFLRNEYIIPIYDETLLSKRLSILGRFYPEIYGAPEPVPEEAEDDDLVWRKQIVSRVLEAEESGDPRFAGASQLHSDSDKRTAGTAIPRLVVDLREDDRDLIDLHKYHDHMQTVLVGLRSVQNQVRPRVSAGEAFLTDIFEAV